MYRTLPYSTILMPEVNLCSKVLCISICCFAVKIQNQQPAINIPAASRCSDASPRASCDANSTGSAVTRQSDVITAVVGFIAS